MKILETPTEFLREEFSTTPALIYGCVEDGRIVLYSNVPIEGYGKRNGVYRKPLDPKDSRIFDSKKAKGILTSKAVFMGLGFKRTRRGYKLVNKKSRDWEKVKHIFGREEFGYVSSNEIEPFLIRGHTFDCYEDDDFEREKDLVHEGTHIVLGRYMGELTTFPMRIVSDELNMLDKMCAVNEGLSFLMEMRYVWKQNPVSGYSNLPLNTNSTIHREGRILVRDDPGDLRELLSRIKTLSRNGQKPKRPFKKRRRR